MYFEMSPKKEKKDLFDFEEEQRQLLKAINGIHKLIVIQGLRRTGKTSLMKVIFNEIGDFKIYIDAREIPGNSSRAIHEHFSTVFSEFAKKQNLLLRLRDYIEGVDVGVKIGIKRKDLLLSEIFKKIDSELEKKKKKLVVFIDEAQVLKPYGFDSFIAFSYDGLKNIKYVLAGSEISLLDEFVGKEVDAPLFGRVREIIRINKLEERNAVEFLREGFRQANKKSEEDELIEAAGELGGIIGWLTAYGVYALEMPYKKAMEKVRKEAGKITAAEIERFLKNREYARGRYLGILEALSTENQTWSELKNFLIIKEKKDIPDSRMNELLEHLLEYSFIEKNNGAYSLTDPLIKEGAKRIREYEERKK